jgi:hypothetical protein
MCIASAILVTGSVICFDFIFCSYYVFVYLTCVRCLYIYDRCLRNQILIKRCSKTTDRLPTYLSFQRYWKRLLTINWKIISIHILSMTTFSQPTAHIIPQKLLSYGSTQEIARQNIRVSFYIRSFYSDRIPE